ncbi:hypothetical protein K474DRAFT_1707592 [Panus rudis PR-1116 ss-1]|nr:hypothetical protein K474DRAFT_1707592 [Panus rudis PR-1116 ss-1]
MSQYAHLSKPDEEIAAALAEVPPRPEELGEDIAAWRNYFEESVPYMVAPYKDDLPADTEYRVEDHTVPVDGGEIAVRVIIPTRSGAENLTEYPLLVWFHGGGYFLGSIRLDDYLLRRVAVDNRVVIVNVDYRLAPEFPFPTGLNDGFAAMKWAVENAAKFSASPSRGFVIGGSSAGGNMSAALALRARDDPFFTNGKKVTGQLLSIPQVVHPEADLGKYKAEILSREQNKDAPFLTLQDVISCAQIYGAPPTDPYYSVLLAPSHKGLPPAYLQVCGYDPLRDEGLLYEKVLKENGVPTKLDVYPGFPHEGHYSLNNTKPAKKFTDDLKAGLRWLLEQAQH